MYGLWNECKLRRLQQEPQDRVFIDNMMNQVGADAGGAESGFDIEAEECSSRWKAEQHLEQETAALVQVQNSKQEERVR